MKIQEALKNVTLKATYENKVLVINTDSKKEGKRQFTFDLTDSSEDSDYWNTIEIEGQLYDINLWLNDDEFNLSIYGIQDEKTEVDNFMSIPLNGKPSKEQIREFAKKEAERVLLNSFSLIGMDKPENFEDILKFVTDDIIETSDSNSGYISEGDIIIGFRRFIEK